MTTMKEARARAHEQEAHKARSAEARHLVGLIYDRDTVSAASCRDAEQIIEGVLASRDAVLTVARETNERLTWEIEAARGTHYRDGLKRAWRECTDIPEAEWRLRDMLNPTTPERLESYTPIERENARLRAENLALVTARDEGLARESALREAMGFSTPWPLLDVLAKLADAADHLLDGHNCDAHGWEEAHAAASFARQHHAALSLLLSTPDAGKPE